MYDTGTNVGIGTTTPLSKLHVAGDLKVTGTTGYTMTFDGVNISNGAGIYLTDTQGTTFRGPILNDSYAPWFIRNQVNTGSLALQTTGSSGTNLNQLVLISSGNVGIGSASPVSTLAVAGTSTMQNILPASTLTYNLGASTTRWSQLW